ncbi:MAG: GFA family protein [Halioglobus sp.]|nr:GFA family protein [Halioglobus sp.]
MSTYSGSCLCSKVRFEIDASLNQFFLCHCSRCRKNTGSAHAANLLSKTASFRWLTGQASVNVYRVPGSRFIAAFCDTCGSALPTFEDGHLVVPAGSLDSDIECQPNAHIFVGSKAKWDHDLELVPRFDHVPAET